MAEAASILATNFAANASVAVTYSRGADSVELEPTIGRTPYSILDGEVSVEYESRDYIVASSLLVLDGETVLPQRGDQITEASGDIYEVMALDGEHCFRRMGPSGEVLRIHTKGPM
ncbi:MAG: hypothetical protein WC210_08765 [Candidatus Neomarinimicrobiota bacterium]